MAHEKPVIAHLISPYLFQTGSWIHTQLIHADATRPVVLTRQLTSPENFPFEPVINVAHNLSTGNKLRQQSLTLLGKLDGNLYLPHLQKTKAQVIHAHLGWEGARAVNLASLSGLPLVTTFYGRDAGRMPRYPWWRLWYRKLFRVGSRFVVEGPHLGRVLEQLGCPSHKIHVIHLGIDLTRIPAVRREKRTDHQNQPIEILISSSLRPKKGVVSAIRAFNHIADTYPNARLRILGDGPEKQLVQHEIRRHRLTDRVDLEGYVPYERHLSAMRSADLFLAASRTAADGDTEGGAPVALIEAQASGLPIISTQHADIPEVVGNGTSGLLSPEGDDDALSRNLQWLLDHPDLWLEMGATGRRRAERSFNATHQATKLEKLYLSLTH
jgi:colanic acid/amylovoran/stewartan biosynthesis glycosyltransferase WcaL/AmsK/CpsK